MDSVFHYSGMIERVSSSGWEIEVYSNEKGFAPFREWLSKLDFLMRARILDRINRIRDGNFGDHKMLHGGLCELRLHFGSGYRIYYGIVESRIVLLLCGGDKSEQKRDIKRAESYWKNYKEFMP